MAAGSGFDFPESVMAGRRRLTDSDDDDDDDETGSRERLAGKFPAKLSMKLLPVEKALSEYFGGFGGSWPTAA